ncbi:2-(1,2-epoxy-1,2-dihydrophenyl)acetyl-CoA isomerase [Rhodobacterales bacterium HKCCE2091]|nr:2-(1,2-epoxy-1,2-dihydrophenyl)acetyl-CoA isomerase [Rhodobacterales bacterium HKCCE2091]
MGDHVGYAVSEGIGTATLDFPEKRNALSRGMARELTGILARAQEDARVLVITGAGPVFSSGADLDGLSLDDPERDVGWGLEHFHNPMFIAMKSSAIPVVTVVNGPAVGVGAALALAGDIIVAAKSAFFRFGFQRVGLAPDGGASWLLARAVGRVRAMDLILTGRKYAAEDAAHEGLVTRVVADEDLAATAQGVASDIARSAPLSMTLARAAVWNAEEQGYESQLEEDRRNQRLAGRSADFVEGVHAFQQKRMPHFGGR